jgi:hypothetical protein
MRHVITQIRQLLSNLEDAMPLSLDDDFQAGDVVQLHPHTCPTWGGSLFRVTRVAGGRLHGYFLRPHRGGSREAWSRYTRGQVAKIGHIMYDDYDDGWPEPTTAELAGEVTTRDVRALARAVSRLTESPDYETAPRARGKPPRSERAYEKRGSRNG